MASMKICHALARMIAPTLAEETVAVSYVSLCTVIQWNTTKPTPSPSPDTTLAKTPDDEHTGT